MSRQPRENGKTAKELDLKSNDSHVVSLIHIIKSFKITNCDLETFYNMFYIPNVDIPTPSSPDTPAT